MFFRSLALKAAQSTGSAGAFLLSIFVILAWLISGPYFHFSDSWQLIINSITSVATFLMVFLIQNTQNRDTAIIQLKLDELIRAGKYARTELVQMENLSDAELEALQQEFREVRERASARLDLIEASRRRRQNNPLS